MLENEKEDEEMKDSQDIAHDIDEDDWVSPEKLQLIGDKY